MHSYLRTLGFSSIEKRTDERTLLQSVIQSPDRVKSVLIDQESSITMLEKRFGACPPFGIRAYGVYDEKGEFCMEYYMPFVENGDVSTVALCNFTKMAGNDMLTGSCDDFRVGLSLIFTVSNFFDVLAYQSLNGGKNPRTDAVCLTGLCSKAQVLLPMMKSANEMKVAHNAMVQRISWLKAAKEGDKDAIENLTVEDMNTYNVVSKRIMKEDLYTVIDSFFIPTGVECDQYQMMGEILACETFKNDVTGEQVHQLLVRTNDVDIAVCVNEKDLVGELMVGRRLKCDLWLQGETIFH